MGADNHTTMDMSEGRDDKPVWEVRDMVDSYHPNTVGTFLREKDAKAVAQRSEHYKLRERTAYGSVESYDNE